MLTVRRLELVKFNVFFCSTLETVVLLIGYTEHHSAGWCHQVGWDAAWQWLGGIHPASFVGSPRVVHSRNHDRRTPCSAEKES